MPNARADRNSYSLLTNFGALNFRSSDRGIRKYFNKEKFPIYGYFTSRRLVIRVKNPPYLTLKHGLLLTSVKNETSLVF